MVKKTILSVIFIGIIASSYFLFFRTKETPIEVAAVDPEVSAIMKTTPKDFVMTDSQTNEDLKNRYSILKTFIQHRMMSDNLIVTNYLPNEENQTVATGHDLLSESAGYYLLDLALRDTQGRFDAFYTQTKKTFYTGTQFSYRITQDGTRYKVNASLDDLRIIRSLIVAKERFQTTAYDDDLAEISKNFLTYSTNDGLLIDFYDEEHQQKSTEISLFYLDYRTLAYLYQQHNIDERYLQYQVNIAKNGYISDAFPLFHQKYNYETAAYEDGDTINIIESLLTIRYLAELGIAPQKSIDFVKEHVAKGTLFNSYDLQGNPVDKNQSAASYAIAVAIARYVQDEELHQQALSILENFQVMDPNSQLYGGFGDPQTLDVYSFNNLLALMAYDF